MVVIISGGGNVGSIKKNILVTGLPGTGETTLIRKLSGRLEANRPAGFYTGEIRERRSLR